MFRGIRFLVGAAALVVLSVTAAVAQTAGTVRGKAVAAGTLRPLEGAQAYLVGTGRGALSSRSGEFLVAGVPAGAHQLRVQLLGYETRELPVEVRAGGVVEVTVELAVAPVALDELVVTGQPGATRRRAIGASVAAIDAEEAVSRAPVSSVATLLQAREPGVVSLGASGTVGTGGTLVLRGMKSITQDNAPVVYLDGVRVDAGNRSLFTAGVGGQTPNRLNDLTPQDIERVEVVRGAAASALYGTEASNGVVQIFTRKGRVGESVMSASTRVGASRIPAAFPLMHPEPQYPSANDLLSTSAYQEYAVSLRSGTEHSRHYLSASYLSDQGSFASNFFERATGRVNVSLMPGERLMVDISSGLGWSRGRIPFNDNNGFGILFNVLAGNPVTRGTTTDPYGGLFLPVPYAIDIDATDETYRFTGGVTLDHRHSGAFSQRATLGLEVVNGEGVVQWPYAPNVFRPQGSREMGKRDNVAANLDYAATWTVPLSGSLESSLSAGAQVYTAQDHRIYARGMRFPTPGLTLLGATSSAIQVGEELLEYTTGGVFVQEQLGLADRLYLSGGVRVDGSSAFGENFGLQAYPKASVSYVVSEEDWFRVPLVSALRLRGGFGMAGTQPGAFDAMRTFTPFSAVGGQPAIHAGEIGNPDLAPEVSHEWEGGLDAGLFGDRMSLAVNLYHQTTRDALLRRPVAPSTGYLGSQLVNVGRVRNTGVEISADARIVETARLSWSLSATFASNRNEVLEMAGTAPFTLDRFGTRVVEGYPLGGKWEFVTDSLNANGYPVRSAAPVYLGTGIPPRTGTVGSQLGMGAVQLFANAQWAAGHVVLNNTRAYMLRMMTGEEYYAAVLANNDNPANPQTDAVRRLLAGATILGDYAEDGDWLKLRELGLTYSLPAALTRGIGTEQTTLSLSGRNLLTLTSYTGADPEVSATIATSNFSVGNDFFTVPQARQLVLGVDVKF